jgi:hypothetical protein
VNEPTELLSEALPTIGDNSEEHASRAAMTTWKITVDKIQQTNPDSVRVLELLSFLGSEEIPEELLNGVPFLKNDSLLLHKTVQPLLRFALLSPGIFELSYPSPCGILDASTNGAASRREAPGNSS